MLKFEITEEQASAIVGALTNEFAHHLKMVEIYSNALNQCLVREEAETIEMLRVEIEKEKLLAKERDELALMFEQPLLDSNWGDE